MTINNKANTAPRFIISGGGTGGHIFPALSIAQALRRRYPSCAILFVGAEGRMEMKRVPEAGFDIVGLPVMGFDRKRLWRNFKVLAKLYRSMTMARSVIRNFKPDAVIGVGGYASGPTLKEAQKMGIPTLVQEQNSYAGVTNKMLAAKAGAICVAYEGMDRFFPSDKIVLTGNPVRPAVLNPGMERSEAVEALGFDPAKPLVLVVGGSLGARTLNNAMLEAVRSGKAAEAPFQVLWQCGSVNYKACSEAVEGILPPNVKLQEFISDMAVAYRAADLVVSRAGAGTISELELLGKPCILVPSPNVAEDHQRHNAEALEKNGAAKMILDVDAPAQLWDAMCSLMAKPEELNTMSEKILAMALRNSDERIVDAIATMIRK